MNLWILTYEPIRYVPAPYIKATTERVNKILRPYNVRLGSKPTNTLKSKLCILKDKINDEDKTNCVYQISCGECPAMLDRHPELDRHPDRMLGRHPENSKYELRSINVQLLLSTLIHWFISIFRKQITFSTGIVQNLYSPTPIMNVEEFWKVFTVSKFITAFTGRKIYQKNISHFWKTIIDHCTLFSKDSANLYLYIYLFIFFIGVICAYTSYY